MESIISQSKIHFYQYMEIQILHDYILSGIQYMVKSILNSNEKLISLRYYSQEIAAFISGIKDLYFLVRHKGLYAESFYGLERANKRNKLTILFEVLLWIILPYIFRKLQQKYNQIQQKQAGKIRLSKLQKTYRHVFPVVYCLTKIVAVVMKFRYLIQPDAKFYSPQYCLSKAQLGYIQQEEPSPFPIVTFLKSPGLFLLLVAHKIVSSFFSMQKKKKVSQQAVSQIQAPIKEKKVKQCPICGKQFKNPAVLRSSGYVFCYNCIVPHVKNQKKCPVTQIQSDEAQIQIIYQ